MEIKLFGKPFFVNKVLLICLVVFLMISSGVLGYFLKQVYQPLKNSDTEEISTKIIQSQTEETSDELTKPEQEPEIKIYVIGCVNKPGVVTIKKGQVIDDAIKIAGGATKEADLENINLAYKLNENTMLRIKSKVLNTTSSNKAVVASSTSSSKANKTPQPSNSPAKTNNSKVTNAGKMNSGVDVVTDSLGAVVIEDDETNESGKKNTLININKASQVELENLPNVGPATAKAIIDYREKNDGFKKLTDIMKITGIKQKTYDKIKEFICIE